MKDVLGPLILAFFLFALWDSRRHDRRIRGLAPPKEIETRKADGTNGCLGCIGTVFGLCGLVLVIVLGLVIAGVFVGIILHVAEWFL